MLFRQGVTQQPGLATSSHPEPSRTPLPPLLAFEAGGLVPSYYRASRSTKIATASYTSDLKMNSVITVSTRMVLGPLGPVQLKARGVWVIPSQRMFLWKWGLKDHIMVLGTSFPKICNRVFGPSGLQAFKLTDVGVAVFVQGLSNSRIHVCTWFCTWALQRLL